jgi:hypothetical protein
MQYHGNGLKSRKNKILLAYIKNPRLLHEATTSGDYRMLHISSMAELKQKVMAEIRRSGRQDDDLRYVLNLNGEIYRSSFYSTDGYNGLCEDGDSRSIRYVSAENDRVFKMKAGKLFRKLVLETPYGKTLPEQVITYLCEEFAQAWQTYAMGFMPQNKLFVNRDFERIYDSDYLDGDFDSCMVDKGYHSFYEDAVDASAAYLENEDSKIIARCIIYNKVTDEGGKVWRLAERQYCTGCNDLLKRTLIDALIRDGHIDGYKTIGAGCGEPRAFVDTEGNSLSNHRFSIDCNLDWGDTISYQDSFKHYDMDSGIATNYGYGDHNLDITNGELEGGDDDEEREYDDYHEYYCHDVTTVYYHGREMNCDSDRLDDFVWVDGEDEYHHYEDVDSCGKCYEHFLSGNGHYSDLTEEYYCCDSCLEEAEQKYKEENWTYSEYDEEYFEDEDDVTEYFKWLPAFRRYESCTISREALESKVESGDFYDIGGKVYDAINKRARIPYKERLVRNASIKNAA